MSLYDVNTLYIEAEEKGSLPKNEYSQERRVDPQIGVERLVDRAGFPLEFGYFEATKTKSFTMIPIVKDLHARKGLTSLVIVDNAGTPSAANLKTNNDTGLRFIVGSRQTKAPNDPATFFTWNGGNTDDAQLVDALTSRATVPKSGYRTLMRSEHV